ncbi:MAG: hypothetical protein IIW86_02015 [Clostridia bacterium]|nr:hypothetical protein [Clostridia bacterium]
MQIPVYGLSGITDGIYSTSTAKAAAAALPDGPAQRKARVLIQLASTDPDAYRLARLYMPYVVDIDPTDGGYYFPSLELAGIAADGEEQWVAYCASPAASELGKIKLLSKIGKAFTNAGKAVVNAGKAVANSVANVAKSGANVLKATGQLVTGNAKGAGETIKKAGQQLVDAHVDPVKTAVKDTVTMVKDSFDIFKETVTIAGKVFKVLFIKINPVTVAIRNSWRGLMAINFLGMATRLAVGLMTWGEAEKAGYSYDTYQKAVKAVERAKKLYKKMGGNADKLVKTIKNGASKKPLFSKDIRPDDKVNLVSNESDDGETTLGEPATVATMVAACVGILTSVWAWIKDIVVTRKEEKEAKAQQQADEEQRKYNAEHYEVDANGNLILDQYGRAIPKGTIDADQRAAAAQMAATQPLEEQEGNNNIIKYVAIGAAVLVGGALLMGGKKGGKKRK